MHGRTILVLLACVAGLALLLVRRERETEPKTGPAELALFAGVDAQRVRALRIDHREEGVQVKLERGPTGAWLMVDPLRGYPADPGLVGQLLQLVEQARGTVVEEGDLRKLGLDPPRALLEVVERSGEGMGSEAEAASERRVQVLLGALDVDGESVYVQVEGRLVRTSRSLDNTLARKLDAYRSRRVLEIDPAAIVGLRRTWREDGVEAGVSPLLERAGGSFRAERTAAGWQVQEPARALLDPLGAATLQRAGAFLAVERFVDDAPVELARYGLDLPRLEIELTLSAGESQALLFGRPAGSPAAAPGEGDWMCMRRGGAHVYRIGARDVALLCAPVSSLLDYRFMRYLRADVQRVSLRGNGGGFEIEREGASWFVKSAGDSWLADTGKVADLFNSLERVELLAYLPQAVVDAERSSGSLAIQTRQGLRFGGEFGESAEHVGARGTLYKREGDDLVALAPDSIAALVHLRASEFKSLTFHRLIELEQLRLVLRQGARERRYVLSGQTETQGRWFLEGVKAEARELTELLDPLLSLQAERWLDEPAATPLLDAVEIEFEAKDGRRVRFEIGLGAAGKVECREEGRRALLKRQKLHKELLQLLGS